MSARRIAEQWATYRERVMPPHASIAQVTECRRAFYAGVEVLLRTIMRNLDPGDEPTEADMQRMADLEAELQAFVRDVEAGRA